MELLIGLYIPISKEAEVYFSKIDFNVKLGFLVFAALSSFLFFDRLGRWLERNNKQTRILFVARSEREIEQMGLALNAQSVSYEFDSWGCFDANHRYIVVDRDHKEVVLKIIRNFRHDELR